MNLLALLLLVFAAHAHAYKILCISGVPSHSHDALAKGIVDALLKNGHEVTWGTVYPEKVKLKPNLHIIDFSVNQNLFDGVDISKGANDLALIAEFAKNISKSMVSNKALREAVVKQQFDAVITEWFFTEVDAGYAAVQQVPWVLLCSTVLHPQIEGLVDEVRSVTTVPMMMYADQVSIPMTFWQRVSNVAIYGLLRFKAMFKESTYARQYEQQFGPLAAARGVTLPPFSEAKHNISVLLVNSHPSISTAQVLPANVVDIAGYHISETTEPLPQDLQDILDASKQGVVYFSMGSVLRSEVLPEHTRNGLIEIFKELPYTVLWKFDKELPGLPKNVHVRPWFPQASILAHPNVKVFITHGGLLSTLEAIHNGVPLLAIPVFGDQLGNAARAVRAGYAKMVPFSDHMVPELRVTLNEILADDRFYKKAKYLSKLFNNRPVPPSKLISHYVELAIESKGAYHLRSPSNLYAWYERWMVDFIALVVLLLYIVKIILTRLWRALFSGKAEKTQRKMKSN